MKDSTFKGIVGALAIAELGFLVVNTAQRIYIARKAGKLLDNAIKNQEDSISCKPSDCKSCGFRNDCNDSDAEPEEPEVCFSEDTERKGGKADEK